MVPVAALLLERIHDTLPSRITEASRPEKKPTVLAAIWNKLMCSLRRTFR
jgi:hypothetical protein